MEQNFMKNCYNRRKRALSPQPQLPNHPSFPPNKMHRPYPYRPPNFPSQREGFRHNYFPRNKNDYGSPDYDPWKGNWKPYSANHRLNEYRQVLNTTHEPIKVHTALVNSSHSSSPSAAAKSHSDVQGCTQIESLNKIQKNIEAELETLRNSQHDLDNLQVAERPGTLFHQFTDSMLSRPVINDDNEEESMDWSSLDEKEVLSNIQEVRKTRLNEQLSSEPQTALQKNIVTHITEMPKNTTMLKETYIVIDTNVFISHLDVVKNVLNIKMNGVLTPMIMIPWMVIQELDYMKDGRSGNKLQSKAKPAIEYINKSLSENESLVKGQSIKEALQQEFSSKNPDDCILNCCLQILNKGNRPILLSNDVNLRNKVFIHGIVAYKHDEILQELDPYDYAKLKKNVRMSEKKVTELSSLVCHTLSLIIFKELINSYGDVWYKMNPLKRNPPWNLEECLSLLSKYWQPVFSLALQKQILKVIDDIETQLENSAEINLVNNKILLDLILNLLMYLKNGFPAFEETIDDCVSKLS